MYAASHGLFGGFILPLWLLTLIMKLARTAANRRTQTPTGPYSSSRGGSQRAPEGGGYQGGG